MTATIDSRVLVVDDEITVTKLIQESLEYSGYQVIGATSGDEAIALYDAAPFDLVITDLMMPGMHGFELMEKLRSRNSALPIIVFSSHDTRDIMREAMKHGAYDFLAKPIILEELHVTVRNALDNVSSNRERTRAIGDLERLRMMLVEMEDKHPTERDPSPRLLRGWKPEEVSSFRGLAREVTLPAGEQLIWEGTGGPILFVVSGVLSLGRSGKTLIRLFPGDSWGAQILLNVTGKPLNLFAETDSRLLRIASGDAINFFRQHEERIFKLVVINMLHQYHEWMESIFERPITGG